MIWDWGMVYDRIGIGKGRGEIGSDKTAPYGVASEIIFGYGEGGSCMDIFDCYIDVICV